MYKKIGEIMEDMGFVSEAEVVKTLDMQKAEATGRRIGEFLIENGIPEDLVFKALAVQFNMPFVEMKEFPATIPLDKISFNFLENNVILPLELKDNLLRIAVGDPLNTEGVEALRSSFSYEISVALAITSNSFAARGALSCSGS
jgi:type IV pilus assembly protein PilB